MPRDPQQLDCLKLELAAELASFDLGTGYSSTSPSSQPPTVD